MFGFINRKRAEKKYQEALNLLEYGNHGSAMAKFNEATYLGHADSMYYCARYCLEGYVAYLGKRSEAKYPTEERYRDAYNYARQGADLGEPGCMAIMGNFYFKGTAGCNVDYKTAFNWFTRAVDGGYEDDEVYAKLGILYYRGAGIEKNLELAYRNFCAGADLESDYCKVMCAKFLINGWGTSVDYDKAFKLLKEAEAEEYTVAYLPLGECYEKGLGIEKDFCKALHYYKMAIDGGEDEAVEKYENLKKTTAEYGEKYVLEAQSILENVTNEQEFARVYDLMEKAMKFHNPKALYYMGKFFYDGKYFVKKDYSEASILLEMAYDGGCREAAELYVDATVKTHLQNRDFAGIIRIFLYGELKSLKPDISKAVEYCCVAAKSQAKSWPVEYIPPAPSNNRGKVPYTIAREYERCGTNYNEAIRFYKYAADVGYPDAYYRLYMLGNVIGTDDYKKWEAKAKSINHPKVVNNWAALAKMATEGDPEALECLLRTVNDNNIRKAISECIAYMYSRLAHDGDAEAMYKMEMTYKKYFKDDSYRWKDQKVLDTYGLWLLHKAKGYLYRETDVMDTHLEYADKALATGVKRAKIVYEDAAWQKRERHQQYVAEQKRKEQELKEYERQLNNDERFRNFLMNGYYVTDKTAAMAGLHELYEVYERARRRERKIEEFKRGQD